MSSDTAREKLLTPPALPARRFALPSISELLADGRGGRALAGAAALFLFLLFVLYVQPLGLLPGYPAVVLALIVWGVVPGWLAQRALFRGGALAIERVAVAFLLSVALSAPAGIVALRLHWTIEGFGVAYALLAAVASGLALLVPDDTAEDDIVAPAARPAFDTRPLLLLVAVPVLAIATSPWWSSSHVARDADDWVYMTYVNQYVHHELDATEAAAGSGSYQRMRANVWVADEALIAKTADVAPHELLLSFLPPLLTLLALAGTFALARGISGRTSLALLAVAFLLGYAALDLSPHEGFGRNLFLRIGEDKMVASFVLLPVAVLLGWRFIMRPRVAAFIAALAAGIALFAVHPMGLLFLGIAVGSFTAWRALIERSPVALAAGVALALPLLALGAIAAAYLSEQAQTVVAVYDTRLLFRGEFHVQDVGGGFSIGDYHLLLHPLVLLGLAAAPLVWLRARRDAGAQLVFAMALAVPVLFFTPPLTTALGDWFSENSVWRLPWMLPTAIALALLCEQAVTALDPGRLRAIALPVAVVGVLAVALVVQEYYYPRDDGSFYNRTSSTALLPRAERSIVLGGIDRAFSGDWRLRPDMERLATGINDTLPAGSTVLAEGDVAAFLPGLLTNVRVYGGLNAPTYDELQTQRAFYGATFDDIDGAKQLARDAGIDYVVVTARTPAAYKLQTIRRYYFDRFAPRLGNPEAGTFGIPSGLMGWAFDANSAERLAGRGTFTIPADISSEEMSLDFSLSVSPLRAVAENARARFVVSYFEPVANSEIVSVVFDVELRKGMRLGAPVRLSRSPSTTVAAGQTYAVVVSRLAESPEDTYPDDMGLFGLTVQYQPQELLRVTRTAYSILATQD